MGAKAELATLNFTIRKRSANAMMDAVNPQEHSTITAKAWRVDFRERPGNAEPGAIVVKAPRRLTGVLNPIDCAAALAAGGPDGPDSLTLVWIPPETATPPRDEREAQDWVESGGLPGRAPVRAGVRTIRVFWQNTRAAIFASEEQLQDAIDAVVRFTVAEREMIALESQMEAMWASLDEDAPLTHAVTRRDQKRQSRVNEMTELAARMRAAYLRLSKGLEQPDRSLSDSSKRLYSELILGAGVYDRLEQLEEPIQFAQDQYELANTRLIEARNAAAESWHALTEFGLEIGIILLLLFQIRQFL